MCRFIMNSLMPATQKKHRSTGLERVTAVIVTHNSPSVVRSVVQALLKQTYVVTRIVVVDSGSRNVDDIKALEALSSKVVTRFHSNIGFAAGNNVAINEFRHQTEYFALINPDLILTPNWIDGAIRVFRGDEDECVGIVSSPTLGIDIDTEIPTGRWDALGTYRRPFGRWKELGKFRDVCDVALPDRPYEPDALLGALMFFRSKILETGCCSSGFFDARLFTFKEDVEVSLRVRKSGYKLIMVPSLVAYHCRGWPRRRLDAPYWARCASSRNDAIISARHFPWELPFFIAKYAYAIALESVVLAIRDRIGSKRVNILESTRKELDDKARSDPARSEGFTRTLQRNSDEEKKDRETRRPAIFLSGVGVLKGESSGMRERRHLEWVHGAENVIERFNKMNYLVFMLISKPFIEPDEHHQMTADFLCARMRVELSKIGAWIDDFRECSHASGGPELSSQCSQTFLKENAKLISELINSWGVDVSHSLLITNETTDLEIASIIGVSGYAFEGNSLTGVVSKILSSTNTEVEPSSGSGRSPCFEK